MKRILGVILINIALITNGYSKPAIINPVKGEEAAGKIVGRIIDFDTEQPMEYANIAIYNKVDSTLISGGITDPKGEFEIEGVSYGEYYLEANFIGFTKSQIVDITLNRKNPLYDAGRIKLNVASLRIGNIDVVADKSAIEYKLDKKVVNVSQVINAAGGTAVDVLENTPSVQVDIEGNVSLRGSSNFTVLIDGRPSVLSGTDALRQIPASALENIEIITNPSAKYEPDGMAGIINLVMKKNSLGGVSGIINTSIGTGDKYRSDITLNFRTKKYNFFVGADWRDETNYGSMLSKRESYINDTTDYLNMDGERNFIRGGYNFKSGIDLFLTGKTTLSISGEIGKSKNNRGGGGSTHSFTLPQSEDIYSVNEEISDRENNFYSGNINLQHNFKTKGHKIEAMAFYSDQKGSDTEEEIEFLSNSQYIKTTEYLDRVFTTENEKEKEFRFKADYTLPLNENSKFEAGLQSRMDKEYEDILFKDFDQASNSWVTNDNYSSSTDFKRDVHAVYSTYSNKIENLSYMGGLRGEYTNRSIGNSNATETANLKRFDLFPTLHLSYKIRETNELMASYSRRINRPRGRDLDPAPNYMNRFSIRTGNPNLKPEYTNSYEIGFMKRFGKSYLSLEAFRRITDNKINRIETLGDDGIFYQTSDNFNKDYSTGLELMGNINFTKWLMVNASITSFNYRITGELNGESINQESTNWSGRMNTTFKFSSNSRMQIMGFYRGKSVSVQGEQKAMFFSNVSYKQDFMKKKLTATLSVRDPLGTGKFERESFGNDFKSFFRWKREPRVVMLTLSYKLNNFKSDHRDGNQGGGGEGDMGGEF